METTTIKKGKNGLEVGGGGLREYFEALSAMVKRPGEFFQNISKKPDYRRSIAFLLLSSLFFAGASLLAIRDRQIETTLILWVNAVGMPVISALFCFVAITLATRKQQPFRPVFTVFAHASGTTMLVSWIPLFGWATELWKWYLVGLGLMKVFDMKPRTVFFTICATLTFLFLFFNSIFPMVNVVKGYL